MTETSDGRVTALLEQARNGDTSARDHLYQILESELRAIASKQMKGERPDHSLQATVLVDDTLLKLIGQAVNVDWENRRHFYRAAARTMRRLLIDHERGRRAQRRGGGEYRRSVREPNEIAVNTFDVDLLALDEALSKLTTVDARQSEIVELHHFGGCTMEEAANILDLSVSTVKYEWKMAKAWLHRELSTENDAK